MYVEDRIQKRNLGAWRERQGGSISLCHLCQVGTSEIGDHLLFNCM